MHLTIAMLTYRRNEYLAQVIPGRRWGAIRRNRRNRSGRMIRQSLR